MSAEESGSGGRSSSSRGSGRTPAYTTSLAQSIGTLDGSMATDRSNYNTWRFRIVRFLKEKELLLAQSALPRTIEPLTSLY